MVLVSAPGKIILFGEHSVVYGGCAIGFAINKRIFVDINKTNNKVVYPNDYIKETVELLYKITKIRDLYNFDIRIEKSEIPIGRGLGSSAAMVVSTIVGLNEELNLGLDNNVIPIIGKEVEKNIQGFASGFDPMVSYYGGSIFYKIGMKKDLNPDIFPKFYIMDTGITSYTKDMVKNVAVMKKKYKNIVENIFETIKQINSSGTSILLVEQNVTLALDLAERAYVLEKGEIRLSGKCQDLSKNEYVKNSYLGIS